MKVLPSSAMAAVLGPSSPWKAVLGCGFSSPRASVLGLSSPWNRVLPSSATWKVLPSSATAAVLGPPPPPPSSPPRMVVGWGPPSSPSAKVVKPSSARKLVLAAAVAAAWVGIRCVRWFDRASIRTPTRRATSSFIMKDPCTGVRTCGTIPSGVSPTSSRSKMPSADSFFSKGFSRTLVQPAVVARPCAVMTALGGSDGPIWMDTDSTDRMRTVGMEASLAHGCQAPGMGAGTALSGLVPGTHSGRPGHPQNTTGR